MEKIRTTEIMDEQRFETLNKWEKKRTKGRSRMMGRKGRKHRLRKFEKC